MSGGEAGEGAAGAFAGKVAVVTGGSKGIGRVVVEGLLAQGASVAFTYHRGRDEAAALAGRHPGRASCHVLDLGDAASIARCFEAAGERWGRADIVVNNAAVGSATVAHYEPDAAKADEAIFRMNAIGAFEVCRAALRLMGERADGAPAKLINVASVGGIEVFPSMRLSDNMSKAAVVYMSRQLAAELAQSPIDVFAICPGATDTAMFRESTLDKLDDGGRARLLARLPKRRLIRPEEIAQIILFLASPHSAALHGAVLDASMGLGVHPGLITGGGPL